jgi:peptidyl-prolyl cis-trans isomerase D
MLSNIRNFSKTLFAKILLVIIIIPFVFWGMGGVFNSGNSNNIVKINNDNISTQDFMNHLNSSGIEASEIKKNIENNILEDLLGELISKKLISMEIQDLNLSISDKSLVEKIINNKNFFDENKKFSRTKYEKFLLLQNMSAPEFETRLMESELQKKLFSYISGGIKSPFFFINNVYKDQSRSIELEYINLKNNYKKQEDFNELEINKFIQENKDNLKNEYIDFSFIKITPKNLIGINEFNKLFFQKIDEIENKISNGNDFKSIIDDLKITPTKKNNYIINNESHDIEKKIYKKRNENKIQLIEETDSYILYEIFNINKILPKITNSEFKNKILKILYEKNKYEYNKKIFESINNKNFNKIEFNKISNNNIQKIKLDSIRDDKKFNKDSIKLLYSLPKNTFTLISDNESNVYIAQIINSKTKDILKESNDFKKFSLQADMKLRDNMYTSYDYILNNKYNVKINEKTLERVKNYFK